MDQEQLPRIWLSITTRGYFDRYQVSSEEEVRLTGSDINLEKPIDRHGYYTVGLERNGKTKQFHMLMTGEFIGFAGEWARYNIRSA